MLAMGVRRPVGMLMVVLATVVFGLVSLGRLPFDLLPPVDYPSLTVRTFYPGAAPEDVEQRITERLEDALATVGNLVRIRSSSRAEVSEILLEFDWDARLDFLVQDVRERLDRVFLPPGAERPLILRYDPSLDPILRIALSGSADLVRLRDVAERELERELESLDGVAAVKVRGGLEDEIHVLVDPQRLAARRVPPELIRQRLLEENLNVPGGTLEEGSVEYVVRTLNEFGSLEEIRDVPVLVRNGIPIHIRDLAVVRRAARDRDVILRVGGEEAVGVDVVREAGANIVQVADRVLARLFGTPEQQRWLAEHPEGAAPAAGTDARQEAAQRRRMQNFLANKLPGDLHLTVLSDQSRFVRGAIREVRQAGLAGGFLAVLVCFLFLRRHAPTLVIALSIPVSVVATFGVMYLAGVSLNVMSLGGLALGIGMLVDNTIVVLESITRFREDGSPPLEAAVRGVREVGSAVTASTLTTVAVFAPIVFVEGIAGQTFGDQAMTVVASLSVSLAVALFFIPGLAARLELAQGGGKAGLARVPARVAGELRSLCPRLRGALRRRPRLRLTRGGLFRAGFALLSLGGSGLLLARMAPLQTRLAALRDGGGTPAETGSLEEQAARLMVLGLAAGLPALWLLGQPVLVALGGLVQDVLGVLLFALRWTFLLLAAPVAAVLALPAALVSGFQSLLDRGYPRFLRGALRAPAVVLAAALLLGWLAARTGGTLGRELLPEVLQGELTAELYFPPGLPLEETDRLATGIERRLAALPGVEMSAVLSGVGREEVSAEEGGPHVARITLRTRPGPEARRVEQRVEAEVRRILAAEPALARFDLRRPTLLALNAPLEVEILGEDLPDIAAAARQVQEALQGVPGVLDLRSSVRRGNPEVRVILDRERLARHGLQLSEVANRLRLAVEGEISSTFPDVDERLDIRVRADLSRMRHVRQLRDLPVNPGAERPLPLGAVAELVVADGPGEIRHIGSRRAAVVTASLASLLDLGGITDRVQERLVTLSLPPGIRVQVGGQKREMDEALGSLGFALGLAVFLVYAVMAAQFESLLQPFLILFSVPLAGVGAVFALAVTGTPVSVVALLGAVVLAGIVVNNAIVLVDRINRNRAAGLPLEEAIVEAGGTRLRPILMTTTTTVLGMLPLTGWLAGVPGLGGLGGAEGTELRAPMAMVVISGLTASTLLTLIVIPVGYRLLVPARSRRGSAA